jgi:hypothetical protein
MYRVIEPDPFDDIPELGMGFHFGVRDGTSEGFIVLDAEYALSPADFFSREAFHLLAEPGSIPEADIVPSQNVKLFLESFRSMLPNAFVYWNRPRLHQSPPYPFSARADDEFVRYSAFLNDRRIGPGGSLLPGTYATSKTDARLAATGYGAVGRYALPNPRAAIHRFDIVVPVGTSGLVGTVVPAFGQAGGGVEIEFTGGAPSGSVQSSTRIPEY